MAIKTIRVFAEYTSDGYVPMPSQGNIDYGVTVGSTFPETQPSSFQTDDPNIDVAVTTMTDFYVWIRTHGSAWNPSYTRVVRVYPDSPSINSVVMNMIVAVGGGGTTISSGGGVNYYLNGGTSQGILDGSTYYEMNKVPVEGTGVDFFKINTTGFENIAQFVTDAGDPGLLNIPAGNWPLGFYMSASDNSGSPKFYAEIYKYSAAGVFTLLGSSVATPEIITNGQAIDFYTSNVAIPDTTLLVTDRIAIRIFVDTDGNRTINLHTQDSHLSTVGTTFTRGLTAINGLIKQVQFLAIGNAGSDAAIVSSDDTHTINLPTASATKRGLLNSTDWATFNAKQPALSGDGFVKISGSTISYDNSSYQPLDGDLTAIGALAGTSGILKKTGANTWELDTSVYLSTATAASTYQRLDKMVSNLLPSDTEYPNSNAVLAKLALKADAANPSFTGSMNITGIESRINFYDDNNARKYYIGYDSGFLRIYQDAGSASRLYINTTGKMFVPGDLEVGTIAKSGGTASQFLKADGSVDSSTYVTSASLSSYLLSSTAASTYQRLDKMVSNLLPSSTEYPNSNAVINALALKADAANPVFTGNMTISGATPRLYFVDTDQNPDYTVFIDSGFFYIYDQTAGATRFSINSSGNISTGVGKSITAGSFVKESGTASQYLMADGSVSTLSNPVTGTGTGNYITKWETGLTIGNSIIYDNGSSVGIGATTLARKLEVITGNGITNGIRLTYANGVTTEGMDITYLNTGATTTSFDSLYNSASAVMQFRMKTAATPVTAMTIFGSGNISTGTVVDSGYSFDINGTLRVQNNATFSGTGRFYNKLTFAGGNGLFECADAGGISFYTNEINSGSQGVAGDLYIGYRNTNRTYIMSALTVNAAATFNSSISMANSLVISGDLQAIKLKAGTATGYSYLRFYNSADSSRFYMGLFNSGGVDYGLIDGSGYRFEIAGSPIVLNNNGYNVLVGTTTDSGFKFDVSGTGRFYRNDAGNISLTLTNSYLNQGNLLNFRQNRSGAIIDAYVGHGGDASGNFVIINNALNVLTLTRSSGAATFLSSISAGGNIETTGSYFLTGNAYFGKANALFTGGLANDLGLMVSGSNNLIFGNQLTEKMRITSSGVIDFSGNSTITSSNDKFSLGINGTSYAWIQSFGGRSLILQGVGNNVLIGTTTDAGHRLYVSGQTIAVNNGTRAELRLQGGGYNTNYNTSLRSEPGAIGILQFGNNGDNYILVGNTATGSNLQVRVNCNSESVASGTAAMRIDNTAAATFYSSVTATSFFESSDIRLKTLIESNPIIDGIEKLEAKLYEKNGKIELGYFAQDAELIMPHAVQKATDGFLNLSYREIHTAKIARLEKEVAQLKAQLNLN